MVTFQSLKCSSNINILVHQTVQSFVMNWKVTSLSVSLATFDCTTISDYCIIMTNVSVSSLVLACNLMKPWLKMSPLMVIVNYLTPDKSSNSKACYMQNSMDADSDTENTPEHTVQAMYDQRHLSLDIDLFHICLKHSHCKCNITALTFNMFNLK